MTKGGPRASRSQQGGVSKNAAVQTRQPSEGGKFRLEIAAIAISVLAFGLSGAQYLLQWNERLTAERTALLEAQISLGHETVSEMTKMITENDMVMHSYLMGDMGPLMGLKARQAALVNRNFQIMPELLSAHVNTFFMQLQKKSAACSIVDPPANFDPSIMVETKGAFMQAHGVAADRRECESQLTKTDNRFKAYLDDFRKLLGLEELNQDAYDRRVDKTGIF